MNIDSVPFELDDRLHLSITEPFSSRAVVFNELMDKVKNISYERSEPIVETYKMTIAGLERELPICTVNEKLDIAAFVIFGDAELTVAAATELLKICPDFDFIVSPEAKAIPLAHEMSRQSGKKYFVARKKPKLYMTGVFEAVVNSITTEGEQKLYLDTAEAEELKGKRVIIADDVISLGESLKAVQTLLEKAGANVVANMTILAEGDAANRTDIIYLEKLPLFKNDGTVLE